MSSSNGPGGGPLVSVIIITWNSSRWLPACLDALARATAGLPAEVWLVDNGSADDSIEIARRRIPGINVIANRENLGFARANNQAIARSRGRYLLLLNPDTEITEGALAGMIRILDAQPQVGIIGCRLVRPGGEPQECYGLTYPGIRNPSPAVRPGPGHPELVDAAWLGGACMAARRAAVEAVGGLDPDYLMYYEDVDWGLRMRAGGWRVVYWDGAAVVHHGAGDTARVPPAETARRYMTSEMLFHAKHRGAVFVAAVWAARALRALRGVAYYGLLRACGRSDPHQRYERYRVWLSVLMRRGWRRPRPKAGKRP